jgi:hypothetical protein
VPHKIRLAGRQPLASGSARDVYLHPDDPDLLIKVIRKAAIEERYGKGRPWYKRTRRYRHFISYLREIREEIALQAQCVTHPSSLQKIVGFADTDLGFGLVVEAAKDRDGKLAPTLPQLIETGRFTPQVRAHLADCLDELITSPVVLADVHGDNLVYAWDAANGDHFVLIDGIGCKTFIPLHRMSTRINGYAKRKRAAKVLMKADRANAAKIERAATPASASRLHAAE